MENPNSWTSTHHKIAAITDKIVESQPVLEIAEDIADELGLEYSYSESGNIQVLLLLGNTINLWFREAAKGGGFLSLPATIYNELKEAGYIDGTND